MHTTFSAGRCVAEKMWRPLIYCTRLSSLSRHAGWKGYADIWSKLSCSTLCSQVYCTLHCTCSVSELELALVPALEPSCLTTLPHTVNSVRNNNYHLCNELLYIVFLLGDFHQQRAKNCAVLVISLTLQQLPPSKFYANQRWFSGEFIY